MSDDGDRRERLRTWIRPRPLVGDTTSARERSADPRAWRFPDEARDALYRILDARRDVRRFRPEPVENDLIQRVLLAAHSAPSVGHSQPWRFLVLRDPAIREQAAVIAERERQRQAALFADDDAATMLDLKLEGIKEAPIGVVVCCDRRTPAAGVLGRATFPDTDLWSCACAIENLWLAARAEGLGVGWVTLFPPRELAELLGLPVGVEPLGWLCLGWPNERPPAPGLERAGWSVRLPLNEVMIDGPWPGDAPNPPASRLRAPGPEEVVAAVDAGDDLLTPSGSLGVLDLALERLGALGIDNVDSAALVLVACDHAVATLGVSTYPQSVTREVLAASAEGVSLGAATAAAGGLDLQVIDAGALGEAVPGVRRAAIGRRGDLVHHDALSAEESADLIELGRGLGRGRGQRAVIAVGEIGVGNTTVAAALACALLGLTPGDTVGLGAGGDSATLQHKLQVVEAALSRARAVHGVSLREPLTAVAALGGGEFAVLCGVVLGVAERGGAVVLDGFATSIAALVAARMEPSVAAHLIAGQRSRERAHAEVLQALGLQPLLDLRLRSGEGIGAVLAIGLLRDSLAARRLAIRVTDD